MLQPSYLIISALALLFVIIFRKHMITLNNTFFIFDAIGLGLFGMVGIEKALAFGFGGMTRDILINEEPLIFRKDIYALACVFGGLIYYVCTLVEVLPPSLIQLISATSIFLARVLSVKYHISVPVLKGEDESQTIKK